MNITEYQTKQGKRYSYRKMYKDPTTDKWKHTSVTKTKRHKKNTAGFKLIEQELDEKIAKMIKSQSKAGLEELTFHEAIDEWFAHYKRVKDPKDSTIRTYSNQVNVIKKAIDPNMLITRIKAKHLQEVVNTWATQGYVTPKTNVRKYYSNSRINSLYNRITDTFKYVQKQYDMNDISLIHKVDVPKKNVTREDYEARRENYLSEDEYKRLSKAFDELYEANKNYTWARVYDVARKVCEFQYLTGMRIGEVLALQFSDVNFQDNEIDINGTINEKRDPKTNLFGYKTTPKTSSSIRTIKVSERCMNIILSLKKAQKLIWLDKYYKDRDYIFTNTKGNPLSTNKVNEILKKAISKSGIEKNVTTHTLRHTHISILAELGVPLKVVQDRVGHSDAQTTLNIYTHATKKAHDTAIHVLEKAGY